MKKLISKEKKKITQDWKDVLAIYEIYKPLHLIRRVGPLLAGVCLEPVYGGEHYVPVFHTHSLMDPFPVISLCSPVTLVNQKGVRDSISFARHEADLSNIALEFKSQCPEAFEEILGFNELSTVYDRSIISATDFPSKTMTDHIFLMAWCSKGREIINQKLDLYASMIEQWPDRVRSRLNGGDGWAANVRRLAIDSEGLRDTVIRELNKFGLNDLKDYGLICN